MITLLEVLLTAIALVILAPVLVLAGEVIFAMTYRAAGSNPQGKRPRVAVLVPAHNEAGGIGNSLRSVLAQLLPQDRLVVIADNCSDDTAAVAKLAGAEVITRTDATRRGKGYALDFGVRHLEQDPPDTVLVVDADCELSPGSLHRVVTESARIARPVQALYVMDAPEGADLRTRISQLAWIVKNRVRPTGLYRLGLPCQLMGTGMAFPWAGIVKANLATSHIAEDLQLGVELAQSGMAPRFCPDALVSSVFPASSEGIGAQRTRWEHGHMSVILHAAPRLFLYGILHLDLDAIALALDIVVPPLALLTMIAFAGEAMAAALWFITGIRMPLAVLTLTCLLLGLSVTLCWWRYARQVVSFGTLLFVPVYAAQKIPLYLRFLVRRQMEWVRSKRDDVR